jgi:hypothetical protein
MSRLYTLLLCLCCTQLFGQSEPSGANNPLTAGKTTKNLSRLIGDIRWRYFNGQYEISDTNLYIYNSNTRGEFLKGGWNYDTSCRYYNDGIDLVLQNRTVRTYNAQNQLMTETYEFDGGFGLELTNKVTYAYDANGNTVTEETEYDNGLGLEKVNKRIYTYNSKNLETEHLSQDWVNGKWEDSYRSTTTYNADDNITLHYQEIKTGSIWKMQGRTTCTYAGKLLTERLYEDQNSNPTSRTKYTYTGTNIATITQEDYDGTNWVIMNRTTFTYDANNNAATMSYEYWDGTALIPSGRDSFIYDNQNNRIAEYGGSLDMNGVVKPNYRITKTYNSFNQLLTSDELWWNAFKAQYEPQNGNTKVSYNYEQVNVGVSSFVKHANDLLVYPVPAYNSIVLSTTFDKAMNITVSMYDMSGTIVKSWRERAGTNYNKHVDVSDIPAGNYMININAENNNLNRPIIIVRQ